MNRLLRLSATLLALSAASCGRDNLSNSNVKLAGHSSPVRALLAADRDPATPLPSATPEWVDASPGPQCADPSVQRISVPVFPDRADSARVPYAFQYVAPASAELPTIIYLPGGPGPGSIHRWQLAENQPYLARLGMPASYGKLFIDPRSAGCNAGDATTYPNESLTTENLAHDVVEVVRFLKLRDYFVHGHSYGSQFASVLAFQLEHSELSRPRAVLIGGVIGFGTSDPEFSITGRSIAEWEKARAVLPPSVLSRIDADEPLGFKNSRWASRLLTWLYRRVEFSEGAARDSLLARLMLLASGMTSDEDAFRGTLADIVPLADETDGYSERLGTVLTCREITDRDPGTDFVKGHLVALPADEDPCAVHAIAMTAPFDFKDYPVRTPRFMYSGELDPATPPAWARYAFELPGEGPKALITIPAAAHDSFGRLFPDCGEALWNSFGQRGDGIQAALAGCAVKTRLEVL